MSLSSKDQRAVVTDTPINADDGDTVFGKRWGSEIICMTPEQIEALRQGRYIALDIQSEYVVYLQLADDERDTSCPD